MAKIKRKGAYAYETPLDNPNTGEMGWNQNLSALVVPKVAEQALLYGAVIRDLVMQHTDIMDFMLRVKVPRTSFLVMVDDEGIDHPLQNTTRYYVSTEGGQLMKIMPPLAKDPEKWRRIGVESGWKAQPCNDIAHATTPIDYEYYIQKIEKLVLGLR
jgi:hypothetical protein